MEAIGCLPEDLASDRRNYTASAILGVKTLSICPDLRTNKLRNNPIVGLGETRKSLSRLNFPCMTQGRPISRPVWKSHHNNPATLFCGLFTTLSLHTVIFSISCPTAHLDATAGAPQCTRASLLQVAAYPLGKLQSAAVTLYLTPYTAIPTFQYRLYNQPCPHHGKSSAVLAKCNNVTNNNAVLAFLLSNKLSVSLRCSER